MADDCPTRISDARHPQEINVRSEKAKLDNPQVELAAQQIAEALREGRISDEEAEALSVWEAAVAEARACVAKLIALLESHDANRMPPLTAALTWAVLDAKLPEPTLLRPGWILPEGFPDAPRDAATDGSPAPLPVPHIWALTSQPAAVLRAAAEVWGKGHPRAAATLMTDLGGFPVSHLVDAVALGQRLASGRGAAPYPAHDRLAMLPPRASMYPGGSEAESGGALLPAAQKLIARHATTKDMQMMFENTRYVAANPREYLRWAVPSEIRAFLYPMLTAGIFKADPTRIDYVRIDDKDVQRIIEAQAKLQQQATSAEGGHAAAAAEAPTAAAGTD